MKRIGSRIWRGNVPSMQTWRRQGRKISRAQAELRQKQTEQSDALLDIRRQDSETRVRRTDQGDRRLDQGDTRLDILRMGAADRKAHWATMDETARVKLYNEAKLIGGKSVGTRAQWEAEMFGAPSAPAGAGARSPAATPAPTRPVATPNQAQIDRLLAHPDKAAIFDQKFGAGASKRYLGE